MKDKVSVNKILKRVNLNSLDTGLLYHSINDANLATVIKNFKKGYIQASRFFNSKITSIKLVLIYSRKEFNNLIGRQTPDWFVGFTDSSNRIFIMSPSVWEQESSHNKNEFNKTLCHEIAHLFIRQIHKSYGPVWLDEGLACVVAKQKITLQKDNYLNFFNSKIMFLLDTKKRWEKVIVKESKVAYAVAFLLVDFLIRRFGKKNVFELLTRLNGRYNKKKFCQKFEEVYMKHTFEATKEFLAI